MSALDKQEGGSHYKDFLIQPVEFITKNRLGFLEGCVIKRLCRWQAKDGIKDLRKAIHEIELLIELTETAEKDGRHPLRACDCQYAGPWPDGSLAQCRCAPKQRATPEEIAKAAHTIERALEPKLGDYVLSSGQTPPADLKDGTVVWEWYTTAGHQRIGAMHRGQLVRD